MMDESVAQREITPLNTVDDNYEKTILTLDWVGLGAMSNGIEVKNVVDWLLEE